MVELMRVKLSRRPEEPIRLMTAALTVSAFVAITQLTTRGELGALHVAAIFFFLLSLPVLAICSMEGVMMFVFSGEPSNDKALLIFVGGILSFMIGLFCLALSLRCWLWLPLLLSLAPAIWLLWKGGFPKKRS